MRGGACHKDEVLLQPDGSTLSAHGNSSTLGQTKPTSLSLIREGLDQYKLSSSLKDILMASWRTVRYFKAIVNLSNKMATVLH